MIGNQNIGNYIGNYIGTYGYQQLRNGIIIAEENFTNLMTDEGVANLWDVTFGGTVASDPWYIGLIDNSPAPTILTTDTLVAHSGWTEFTNYTGNRQTWVDAPTASRTKGTTSVAAFPILGTAELYGMFIANVATGTAGLIFSEGAFDSTKPVINGDIINATFSVQMA